MTILTLNIPNKINFDINKPELEALLSEFICEYIETQEDLQLKQSLETDSEFVSLNRKLEAKLWNL